LSKNNFAEQRQSRECNEHLIEGKEKIVKPAVNEVNSLLKKKRPSPYVIIAREREKTTET